MFQPVQCPDRACGARAEVIAHWALLSTAGPVEQVRTRCEAGHVFTPLVEQVRRLPAPAVARAGASRTA